MNFWLGVLAGVVALNALGLLLHHVWEWKRDTLREERTEALLVGFRQMEGIFRGAVAQRNGIEEDLKRVTLRVEEILAALSRAGLL